MIKMSCDQRNLFLIIAVSLITKIIITIFTILLTSGLNDTYDYSMYYLAVGNILNGLYPWANGVIFYYPPLSLLPMLISYIFGDFISFVRSMEIIMIACDIGISICVYYIGKKFYNDNIALKSALLCASSFIAAYYCLFRFDALPTLIMMIALTYVIYDKDIKGYLYSIFGLFIKIFPFIIYPFIYLYDRKNLKNSILLLISTICIFATMLLLGYNGFIKYLSENYVNTLPYVLSLLTHTNMKSVVILFHIITAFAILIALYIMYKNPNNSRVLLQMVFISLVAIIYLSQYRSPQYIVWIIPIAALLICNDKIGIASYIALETLSFIEYPFAYGMIYDNQHYMYNETVWFFVLYFVILGILVWRCCKPQHINI